MGIYCVCAKPKYENKISVNSKGINYHYECIKCKKLLNKEELERG